MPQMKIYKVDQHFLHNTDSVVIALRKQGYSAYGAEQGQITTDANRTEVLLVAGHGQFLLVQWR